jgi:hypothetical protein
MEDLQEQEEEAILAILILKRSRKVQKIKEKWSQIHNFKLILMSRNNNKFKILIK